MKKQKFIYALPFLILLGVMTAVSFCLPLRPTVSYTERRELVKFPEITVESVLSGSCFGEITTWFSDTFPFRETWLEAGSRITALHGWGDIVLSNEVTVQQPETPQETPQEPEPIQTVQPPEGEETQPAAQTDPAEETAPEESQPGEETPVNMDSIINGNVIQVGEYGFNPVGYSQELTENYAGFLNDFAALMEQEGVRVVSAPALNAVGVIADKSILPMLRSASQEESMSALNGMLSDSVVKVDTYSPLYDHRKEYIYFYSDHHRTALGAYYVYRATCEAMGLTPAELSEFQELDQGEFRGTHAYKCSAPHKLGKDNLMSYVPQGNITMYLYDNGRDGREFPIIRDMRKENVNSKYSAFLASDYHMVHIINEDLPESAGSCLVIKDSFGNPYVPYFAMNYRHVYAMDYRKESGVAVSGEIRRLGIQDVIIAPNMMAIQSGQNGLFQSMLR